MTKSKKEQLMEEASKKAEKTLKDAEKIIEKAKKVSNKSKKSVSKSSELVASILEEAIRLRTTRNSSAHDLFEAVDKFLEAKKQ